MTTKLKQLCNNCDSVYKIIFDIDLVADEPKYCAVSGQFMIDYEESPENPEDDFL